MHLKHSVSPAVLAFVAAPALAAGPDGVYARPNGTTAKVWTCGASSAPRCRR